MLTSEIFVSERKICKSGNNNQATLIFLFRYSLIIIMLGLFSGTAVAGNFLIPGNGLSLPEQTSIGLTLSGGGARGLAHIGVLHLIDSLGIEVDYISGTSMGALAGGLYASGYSAKEIEEIALSTDWEGVLGMKPELEYVHVRKRRNSGRFVANLPLEGRRIRFKTGVIEGQHLWNVLEELFFHVRGIDNFNDFHIPFACVATNIETGDPVIINQGDIVTAIRASIAIPAVFTTVEKNGNILVDGGVVNNFPVDVVKEMGADFTIGVNVSEGLKSADELQTPVEVIYQMGMFKNAHMFSINKEETDLFLAPDLDGFTAASFSQAEKIIERGKQIARNHYATLDSIARTQSAGRKFEKTAGITNRYKNVVIDSVSFRGLENIRNYFIDNLAGINPGDTLNVDDINNLKNRLYATDYFERITYTYIPSQEESRRVHLIFNFSEKPPAHVNASMHFNSFSGAGIIGGISVNNFLVHNLDAEARVRIGEHPAFDAGLDFFIGSNQRAWGSIRASGDLITFPVYEKFEAIGEYEKGYLRLESSISQSAGRHSFFTAGAAFYNMDVDPLINSPLLVSGYKQGFETFARWNKYSLNQHFFSKKGQNLIVEAAYFSGEDHSIDTLAEEDGAGNDPSILDISVHNFFRVKLNWESYIPLNSRLTYFTHLQAGYNFNYRQGFLDMFNLGGTYPFLRNQISFAGLSEYGIMTSSAVTAGMGWQYNIWSEFYLTPLLNAALYDFVLESPDKITTDQMVLGAGLSIGYLSLVGPMNLSFTYSPQTNKVLAYVNLGWSF